MAYKRKTTDVFVLQGNYHYGHGWEDLTAETKYREIIARKREYIENEPGTNLRVVTRRIKIEGA